MDPSASTYHSLLPFPSGGVLRDQNAELIALWCLRILVHLRGQKDLLGRTGCLNDHILDAIGLGHLNEEQIEPPAASKLLRRRLAELEGQAPRLTGPLADNLRHAAEVLGLSASDQLVLAFAALIDSDAGLDEAGDILGHKLTDERFARALAVTLGVPLEGILDVLSPWGALMSSGLCTLDSDPERMAGKLRLLSGFGNALRRPHASPGDLFSHYLRRGGECRLSLADFPHLDADLPLLERVLGRALGNQEPGCTLLLYGPSGTGKTQLVRALAVALGVELFEVRTEGARSDFLNRCTPSDTPLDPPERLDAYRLSQRILARRGGALVLFDEIEDVFPATLHGLLRQSPPPKAWVNDLIESNPVPAIWVSNQIGQLDPALVRRFTLVIELGNPTRGVRERMLDHALARSGVRPQWRQRLAESGYLSPALIEQAGRLATALAGDPPAAVEAILERMLGNKLQAMGLPRQFSGANRTLTGYRLDYLNADEDLSGVASGLHQDPRGRLCLYGPPGTGKTAFAEHIAQTLDRPLLIKRASDLLSQWLGATEAHIARMFDEAERENALLLLDEADSFLQDRTAAHHSWEVTQVNELLTQMERFDGLFIAATNLIETLDGAALRRFDLKIRFDYLRPTQAEGLFAQVLAEQGALTDLDGAVRDGLARLERLTPGDFAAVIRRFRITRAPWSPEALLGALAAEQRAKPGATQRPMGFAAVL